MTQNTRTRDVESILSELGENPSLLSTGGRAVITFPTNQSFLLDDPSVKPWLKNSCLKHTGALPSNNALSEALQILRMRARTAGSLTPIAVRIGTDNAGGILLDLANRHNECAYVTSHGWTITSFAPTTTFVSSPGELPIPTPDPAAPDATLDPLRPLLNCAPAATGNNESWNGILDWLTAALHADRPCPILILHGPPGSGKTTAARFLRTLIDPNCEPLAVLPSRGPAVERYAEARHVLAFDHITRMSASTADALCRLSSGAVSPSHPIILTAPRMDATDWQPRADLAARTVAVHLPAIEHPRPPQELQAEFEKLRPKLLSALLTKVSIDPAGIHRPLGAETALQTASAQQDPVFKSIHNFMQMKEEWTGTATDLFNEICVTASPRALSHRLRILAPAFASCAALNVKFHRTDGGIRKITLTRSDASQPQPSLTDPGPPSTDPQPAVTQPRPQASGPTSPKTLNAPDKPQNRFRCHAAPRRSTTTMAKSLILCPL